MIAAAAVMITPIAANIVIVVGNAMVCPSACSFCERPKRVKSGMLSDSVAQNPIIAVSDGMNTGLNSDHVWYLPVCVSRYPSPCARVTAQPTRSAVITSTNGAAQFSTIRSKSMPR